MVASLKKTLMVLALLGAGYAGFRWGGSVFPPLERAFAWARERVPAVVEGVGRQPSPELADSTLDRFERFRSGEGPERLALGGVELSSVLRYALPGIVPPGVHEPTVELDDGRVRLSARVSLDAFPKLPKLEDVVGLLPDTVQIRMRGSLISVDQAHLALVVDEIEAARFPLPRRMVGDVLAGFGRATPPGVPPDALSVPLPDGLSRVYVQGDSLVLVAER